MHPNASLHHCLPAGMRKTWLIFLTPCVVFYRLSCAPASQIHAQIKMAEGVICLTAHQTEASCFCCWGAASCLHGGFGESLCSQFPPSCFFSFSPSFLAPSGIRVLLTQLLVFSKAYFKKLFFHSPSLWAQSLTFCNRSREVTFDLT